MNQIMTCLEARTLQKAKEVLSNLKYVDIIMVAFLKAPSIITASGNDSFAIQMISICCRRILTLNNLETPAIWFCNLVTDAPITYKIDNYIFKKTIFVKT